MITIFESKLDVWDQLLLDLSPERISERWLPSGWSIQDTLAHLWTWQQRTIARLEALPGADEPRFPDWPVEVDAEESPEIVDRANAWIWETHRNQSWEAVHTKWRQGFLRLLELPRQVPETELGPGGQLEWFARLEPSPLLPGTYDHHHSEHRALLLRWLRENADLPSGERTGPGKE